jgi:hypothetical protein
VPTAKRRQLPTTSVRRWPATARWALLALFACLLVIPLALGIVVQPQASGPATSQTDSRDVELYRAVVERLRQGEPYYPTLATELRRRHFARRPVFHWRTPAAMTLLALLPSQSVAAALFGGTLSVALLLLVVRMNSTRGPTFALLTAGMVGVALVPLVSPETVLFSESFCALLLFWSMVCRVWNWPCAAAVSCVLALFMRELAAPFCITGGLLAWRRRRWLELGVWGVGTAIYAGHFVVHFVQVEAQLDPHLDTITRTWIAWGGLRHLLQTLHWFGPLTQAPELAPFVFALALLGLTCWESARVQSMRIGLLMFWALLCVAGHRFNSYWGIVPLGPLGLALSWGIVALIDAVRGHSVTDTS